MGMPVIVPSGVTKCQAITDIIESVALQEAALAHILNAEGEKLQAVVNNKAVTQDQLLATNKSVQKMVGAISRLEMILESKLELFEDCICPNCSTITTTTTTTSTTSTTTTTTVL